MPNTYFQFKQFKVEQDKCAMKVTTDACLFGAWVADWLQTNRITVNRIADAGAGTGLLSLLLAQKTEACIDAFELDASAAKQCGENFAASLWKKRLNVFNNSVHTLTEQVYDLTIANPPFFVNHLESDDTARNKALHIHNNELKEWIDSLHRITLPKGYIALLLPPKEVSEVIKQMQICNRQLQHTVVIQHAASLPVLRYILLFGNVTTKDTTTIAIKDSNNYSKEFIELLKDYYLYL